MNDDVKAIIAGLFGALTLVIIAVDYKGFDGVIGTSASAFSTATGALLAKTAS